MLNPPQLAAVKYIDGPLLVLAGAGSGKTRVITQKIAYLIQQCNYAAHNICAVTFTNKAANEMSVRIATVLDAQIRRGLNVATFHTLGLRIIKHSVRQAGLYSGFSIFDTEDCVQLLRGILPATANNREYILEVQKKISHWKNEILAPDEVLQQVDLIPKDAEIAHIYDKYQQALRAYNSVDFDDLIAIPVNLLRTHVDILNYWQNKIITSKIKSTSSKRDIYI